MNYIGKITKISLIYLCVFFSCETPPESPGVHPEAREPASQPRLLVGRSALIFKGVLSGVAYKTDENTGLPYTYYTFRQIEVIKDVSGKLSNDKDLKLTLRNFGGLTDDGFIYESTGVPKLDLGAVYVIFHKSGKWERTPITGAHFGIFRVLKSMTLGYDLVQGYGGSILTDFQADQIDGVSLDLDEGEGLSVEETPASKIPEKSTTKQYESIADFKRYDNSIYTEEYGEKMNGQPGEIPLDDKTYAENALPVEDSPRVKALKTLDPKPMAYERFVKQIRLIDDAHRDDFLPYYNNLDLEGQYLKKELEAAKSNHSN